MPTQSPVVGAEPPGHEVEDRVLARCRRRPFESRNPVDPGLWERNTSAGRLVALLVDQQREVRRVAVADVDADAGVVGELLEQRLDQLLVAPRVDREAVVARAGARAERADHEKEHHDEGCRSHGRGTLA